MAELFVENVITYNGMWRRTQNNLLAVVHEDLNRPFVKRNYTSFCYYVESLFTRVPLQYALNNNKKYFAWDDDFCKQLDGAAVGSTVITNLFMEALERHVLQSDALKLYIWFRYAVDDTFFIWRHGDDDLKNWLDHLKKCSMMPQTKIWHL